jgi:regulator of sirC expression with transglutaminase-like and TPR domain
LNAHRNLGVVLGFDLKDREGALKEFKTYLELAPNTPDAVQIKEVIAQLQAAK